MRLAIPVAPAILLAASLLARPCTAADITVTLPTVSCMPGRPVDVAIMVSPAPAGLGILAIDFRLAFDPAVVFSSSSNADGFLQDWGAPFTHGTGSYLAAAAAGTTPLASASTLLNTVHLWLRPNAVIGSDMPLSFEHILFNEGTPSVAVVAGSLHVDAPAAASRPGGPGGLALALASPNPARGEVAFACSVPAGDAARLALHAIDGRRVRAWDAPAGTCARAIRWDLRDERGERVRPGVYLASLQHGADRIAQRVVVLDSH